MKNPMLSLLISGLAASAAMAQVHPSYTREAVTFTPANLFTSPSVNANLPLTGGMDVFPDGRVALVEWGVPGSVLIFSGLDKGSSGIKVTRFAGLLQDRHSLIESRIGIRRNFPKHATGTHRICRCSGMRNDPDIGCPR